MSKISLNEARTLPELQNRLQYTGSDEQFREYLNRALSNRGDDWKTMFEMYYGINQPKKTVKQICKQFGTPSFVFTKIRANVMDRLAEEINLMMKSE